MADRDKIERAREVLEDAKGRAYNNCGLREHAFIWARAAGEALAILSEPSAEDECPTCGALPKEPCQRTDDVLSECQVRRTVREELAADYRRMTGLLQHRAPRMNNRNARYATNVIAELCWQRADELEGGE